MRILVCEGLGVFICTSRDPFLVGTFLIRVNRELQDISLYRYPWGSRKAMLDSSCLLFSLASSCSHWPSLFPSSHVDIVEYRSGIVGLRCRHFHNFLHACEVDGPNGVVGLFASSGFIPL